MAASSRDSITHHGTSRHRHVHPAQRQQNTLGDRSSLIKETTTAVGATTPFKIPNPKNSLGFTTTSDRDRATGAFIVVLDRPQRPLLIGALRPRNVIIIHRPIGYIAFISPSYYIAFPPPNPIVCQKRVVVYS